MNKNDDNVVTREAALELFLNAVEKCPHVMKESLGDQLFAEETIKGAELSQ